jgi:hypothetical protein
MIDIYMLVGAVIGLAIYDIAKYFIGNIWKRKWGENPKGWWK